MSVLRSYSALTASLVLSRVHRCRLCFGAANEGEGRRLQVSLPFRLHLLFGASLPGAGSPTTGRRWCRAWLTLYLECPARPPYVVGHVVWVDLLGCTQAPLTARRVRPARPKPGRANRGGERRFDSVQRSMEGRQVICSLLGGQEQRNREVRLLELHCTLLVS